MVGVAGLSGGGPILAGLIILGLDAYHATATSTYVLIGMSILGAGFAPLLVKRLYASSIAKYIPKLIAILLIVMGIKTIL
ncbi:hypothetical protein FC18_GL001823 [Lacticaseibacillus sharpeae JCM 1186 = DSM 20505]|uniref:Membrane transporter protein n=2 Tax=Lacticaseibacillus sharpeae TaxID=1626 RepID=A0A0R1ZJA3_9LACO|nr:hypothetical protein FC18_GL001823 [Lacticaseibacillus sharpeae JCM 1186 = DSM 20505]